MREWLIPQTDPSMNAKDYALYNSLLEEDKKTGSRKAADFMNIIRGPRTFDLGNTIGIVNTQDPMSGSPTLFRKGVPPQNTPAHTADVAEASKTAEETAKRTFNMAGIGEIIAEARSLLTGPVKPTSSWIGTGVDLAGSVIGVAPEGAAEADQLAAVGAALVAKMPRMEGPQSDADTRNYQAMAGRIGDPTLPVARRKAALVVVERLWKKYEHLNKTDTPSKAKPVSEMTDEELMEEMGR